jgi:hypothetical protein
VVNEAAPWAGLPVPEQYPFEETYDLRTGPKLHPALEPLVPYIGLWRGRGRGGYPTIDDFTYGQEIRITHDGRPFLSWQSRSWLLDDDDRPVRPLFRETGWWRRPDAGSDELEVTLTYPTGFLELYIGRIDGTKIEMMTDAVVRTSTAKEVTAGHRLFGIVEGALLYAYDMAAVGQPIQPHLSARLERVGG